MALLTVYINMLASQWEVGARVVKRCTTPTLWGVASRAIGAELAIVLVILLMARVAILRCAFEHVVDMALVTFHFGMFAFQFEV